MNMISTHYSSNELCYSSSELNEKILQQYISCIGWIHNMRDHGGILFLELRDCDGIIQIVINEDHSHLVKHFSLETVIKIEGVLQKREEDQINNNIFTGNWEIHMTDFEIISPANKIPVAVNSDQHISDEVNLLYRYLIMRREKQKNLLIECSRIDQETRMFMWSKKFTEIKTPLLTKSSPEGSKDFVVVSLKHKGKFYALPQAPQLYKQLLMVGGLGRYFQIAPCFREEDSRMDRSPGEFYQLDLEICFGTQQKVLSLIWDYIKHIFSIYYPNKQFEVTYLPYTQSMKLYSTDKPDLRNPLVIEDVTHLFVNSQFDIFRNGIGEGQVVKAISMPNKKNRVFFDDIFKWAKTQFKMNVAYAFFLEEWKGPIAKFMNDDFMAVAENGCVFLCGFEHKITTFLGKLRDKLGEEFIDHDEFKFCFITDFPMYEYDTEKKKWDFMHNPFSRPQGGVDYVKDTPIAEIKSCQYDLVCNGFELGSGAERNIKLDLIEQCFEKINFPFDNFKKNISCLYNAFQYGVPPHAGMALGMERIKMLILKTASIRDVIPFPLNQNGSDPLMGSPSDLTAEQLKDMANHGFIPKTK